MRGSQADCADHTPVRPAVGGRVVRRPALPHPVAGALAARDRPGRPVSSTVMSDQPASAPTKAASRAGAGNGQYPEPPAAKRVPTERTHHGDTVIDEYAWLADKDNPETIAFLEAENAYTEAADGRPAGTARSDLRRDQGQDQGDRPDGALPQGRLVVLRPHRRGKAVRGSAAAGPSGRTTPGRR